MDTVMEHYGGLPPDAAFTSLHDDLLNDLHETVIVTRVVLYARRKLARDIILNKLCQHSLHALLVMPCNRTKRTRSSPNLRCLDQHLLLTRRTAHPAVHHIATLQGMADFAESIGIIDSTGQIPDVRIQGAYLSVHTGQCVTSS